MKTERAERTTPGKSMQHRNKTATSAVGDVGDTVYPASPAGFMGLSFRHCTFEDGGRR